MRHRNRVLGEFIAEAIEANDLQFGGGGSEDIWEGIAEPQHRVEATEARRFVVAEWLEQHPQVLEFQVGPLSDDRAIDDSSGQGLLKPS